MKRTKAFFKAIICAGAYGSLKEQFTCKGVNALSAIIIVINVLVAPLFFFMTKDQGVLWGSLVEVVLIAFVIYLNAKHRHQTAGLLFFIVLNASTFYFAARLGKDVNAQLMIIFLIGLASFLYANKKVRAICIGITLASFIVLEYAYQSQLLPALPLSEGIRDMMRWGSYFVIALLVSLLFCIYSNINSKLLNDLEEANEQLQQHLLKAFHANDSKKNFIREIVHEVKSGFNPIEGMVVYLAEKERLKKTKATPEQLIDHIRGGCSSYRRLLSNLLEFSKIEYGKKDDPIIEPLEIRSFMQQVVNEFQYAARSENATIMLQIDEPVPTIIFCDSIKLRQIANNLIHNAIKFVRSGCDIIVKVELKGLDRWQLAVINDGENIPEEQLQKIFQPYQNVRTGINMEGNGLGLFITRKLVEALRGDIEVVRADKMFTVFEVRFPLEQEWALNYKMPESA